MPRPGSRIRRQFLRSLVPAGLALACGACGGTPRDPVEAEPSQAASTVTSTDWSAFNIRDLFPDGEGRELVFNNCQSCHVLVPILVLSMDESAWSSNALEHRERVEGLSDEEFQTLYSYLAASFPPNRPRPQLPPALLDTWTTY
ncbi:MAG: hypothetical protein OXN89_03520 [Bryobacterales bacterium]|nr:hypothetical protein [Bryobacterales bacterium]